MVRFLVFIAFIAAVIYALSYAKRGQNRPYLEFIILVLVFSVPYWVANSILYNQFFYFLDRDVLLFLGLPATMILVLDPLINTVFGILFARFGSDTQKKPLNNLLLGNLLTFFSFGSLSIGVYLASATRLNPVYPILAIILFACAQFLIQTTMSAKVSTLAENKKQMFFGLGVLRSARAFAAIIGFMLMSLTASTKTTNLKVEMHNNLVLYLSITFLVLLVTLSYGIFYIKKTRRQVAL